MPEEVLVTDAGSDVAQEVLEEDTKSILLGLISQLRKGMDLHKVTLPTFVLEPRSMLERFTDFMAHPHLILESHKKDDAIERFLDVVKYFLSGWHIRPKGVKKPYNPVLGEFFRCSWKFEDSTEGYYISEQVSHHPPISAYIYANPMHRVVIQGNFRPKSKFLGNSAATIMQGSSSIFFTDRPGEEYIITNPNFYARGILFGTLLSELGDSATIKCSKTGLTAEIEFKVKGFFGGTYNAICGKVKNADGQLLYTITGKWSDEMFIQKQGNKEVESFLNVHTLPIQPKIVANEVDQDDFESRKLWSKVTKAILSRNLDLATEEKTKIEDDQRSLCKLRAEDGVDWHPRFFVSSDEENWHFVDRHILEESPEKGVEHLREIYNRHPFNFKNPRDLHKK